MSSPTAMRLAPIGQAAANVYNTYHYISQIAGLYSQAAEFDHRQNTLVHWQDLSMLVLDDIELMYKVWEKAHSLEATPEDDSDLGKFIFKSCVQIEKIEKQLNIWVDLPRWSRTMKTLELRYQTILKKFQKYNTVYSRVYEKLVKDSTKRLEKLQELAQIFQTEANKFQVDPNPHLTLSEADIRSRNMLKNSSSLTSIVESSKDDDCDFEITDD